MAQTQKITFNSSNNAYSIGSPIKETSKINTGIHEVYQNVSPLEYERRNPPIQSNIHTTTLYQGQGATGQTSTLHPVNVATSNYRSGSYQPSPAIATAPVVEVRQTHIEPRGYQATVPANPQGYRAGYEDGGYDNTNGFIERSRKINGNALDGELVKKEKLAFKSPEVEKEGFCKKNWWICPAILATLALVAGLLALLGVFSGSNGGSSVPVIAANNHTTIATNPNVAPISPAPMAPSTANSTAGTTFVTPLSPASNSTYPNSVAPIPVEGVTAPTTPTTTTSTTNSTNPNSVSPIPHTSQPTSSNTTPIPSTATNSTQVTPIINSILSLTALNSTNNSTSFSPILQDPNSPSTLLTTLSGVNQTLSAVVTDALSSITNNLPIK